MKRFHCDRCETLVVLENTQCTGCGSRLAFVPDLLEMVAWDRQDSDASADRELQPGGRLYRLCRNYTEHDICNWAVACDEPSGLCTSCTLTRVIPDLDQAGNLARWYRLEAAKRRLLVGLMSLRLPIDRGTSEDDFALAFQFLADRQGGASPIAVLTGHEDGLITINVAEADDAERERRRVEMHEPYRTLVGHLRHEVGHYYWDLLIRNSRRLTQYRKLFGDERADYAQALADHYQNGPPSDWRTSFVSAYAASHPWEDWAETWAHYLHMIDSLETAFESGLSLNPRRASHPRFAPLRRFSVSSVGSFRRMLDRWMALTYILNDLNRGLGLNDAYPFVLSSAAIAKLKFVHHVIAEFGRGQSGDDGAAQPLQRHEVTG